ncbi:hypothetical protein CTZ27_03105 [Streptomyces griseocarneus]|nr:hypothetical protein CTZ27_03105 [Streptomyces griseocarneus]
MDEAQEASVPAAVEPEARPVGDSGEASPAGEVEMWRKRAQDIEAELLKLRQEHMTDREKALAQARTDGRSEALAEMSTQLVVAEVRAQAAAAGVSVEPEFLNLSAFTGEDGRPAADRIAAYVARQTPPEPAVPQLMGAGHHRGGRGAVTSMDPDELADLISGGRFI